MKTDYKFWYITRDDDGFITEAAIRFFEGDYKMVMQYDINGNETGEESVYIRSKELEKDELSNLNKIDKKEKYRKDANGKDVRVFDTEDFREIKTNDELRVFLNTKMKKDKDREPVDCQKETDLDKIKLLKVK